MRVIDLTHTIREGMPVYPGTEPPVLAAANSYEKDGFKETSSTKSLTLLQLPMTNQEEWNMK